MEMILQIRLSLAVILIISIERTFGLKPPRDVEISDSKLTWKHSEDGSVLYTLQYKRNVTSKSEDEWQNVSSHIGTTLQSFFVTSEYHGGVFRVRAEKGNSTSEWVNSSQVQCINVNFCVPIISLSVKPEKVFLTMRHMDDSLEKEYGKNLEFNVSFWEVDNSGKSETFKTSSKNEPIYDLESGKNYCFQVGYLRYRETNGNFSEKRCAIIPEKPEVVTRRVLLFSILSTLLVVAVCGVCIFLFFRNHKKVKQFLQPLPLEIPHHYEQFLSGEFPIQVCRSTSSQSLRSYDMITVIDNSNVEQNV